MNEITTALATRADMRKAITESDQKLFDELLRTTPQYSDAVVVEQPAAELSEKELFVIRQKVNDEIFEQHKAWVTAGGTTIFKFDRKRKDRLLKKLEEELFLDAPEKLKLAKTEINKRISYREDFIHNAPAYQRLSESIRQLKEIVQLQ